jgi:hypothetical protein
MSVSSTTRKQQFPLDGTTADYTFNFRALTSAPEDIKCSVLTAGTTTVLTYTTQYSVSINSDGVGGTVTLVSASTIGLGTLTVYRETTNLQSSDYDDYNQFPANTIENDLDIRTMVEQEQSETFDRTIKFPVESTTTGIDFPEPAANNLVGWNSAGTNLQNYPLLDDAVLRGTFSNANLTTGTLVITHNRGLAAPYTVMVIIVKNTGEKINPSYTCYVNTVVVNLLPWGTLTGTWGYVVI